MKDVIFMIVSTFLLALQILILVIASFAPVLSCFTVGFLRAALRQSSLQCIWQSLLSAIRADLCGWVRSWTSFWAYLPSINRTVFRGAYRIMCFFQQQLLRHNFHRSLNRNSGIVWLFCACWIEARRPMGRGFVWEGFGAYDWQ